MRADGRFRFSEFISGRIRNSCAENGLTAIVLEKAGFIKFTHC